MSAPAAVKKVSVAEACDVLAEAFPGHAMTANPGLWFALDALVAADVDVLDPNYSKIVVYYSPTLGWCWRALSAPECPLHDTTGTLGRVLHPRELAHQVARVIKLLS